MKDQIMKLIEQDLSNADDNLYRATSAFAGQDLSEHYGQSNDTKKEIIDGYQQWHDRGVQMKEWLEAVPA